MYQYRNFMHKFLLIFLVSIVTGNVFAQEKNTIKENATIYANTGVYLTDIYDVDLRQKSFKVSGYVWWNIQPVNTKYKLFNSTEIVNAKEVTLEKVLTYQAAPSYFQAKMTATVNKDWDLSNFPLDHQKLHIYFEDSGLDARGLQYIADTKNSGISKEFEMNDWRVLNFSIESAKKFYYTNFGDIKAEVPGFYSRLIVTVDIERKNSGWLFFYLFIGSFVAAALCMLAFFTRLDSDLRFSLFLGSVFAAVGNQYLFYNVVPRTSYLTLCDKVQIATFILLMLTMMAHILIRKMMEGERIKLARYTNHCAGFIMCSSYIVFIAYIVKAAMLGA